MSASGHTYGSHIAADVQGSHPAHELHLEVLEGANPWTDRPFNNDPRDFQFAVITDRTGGMRPGVLEDAVSKLNWLQPEFVLSVGDLIQGYTEDLDQLVAEWDEFDQLIDPLGMRFFYVPGNHDMTNAVMAELWQKRLGRSYYHFVYNDVLFLMLNSEDGAANTIGPQQLAYIRQVLAAYPEPRWTMVFMHKPLWQYEMNYASEGLDRSTGWLDVEALLKGRKHTVMVGHFHRYAHYKRNDSDYIILATTGGGSQLRGPEYGELDQVVWITMTDTGPRIANLALSGILPKDFNTGVKAQFMWETLRKLEVGLVPAFVKDEAAPVYHTSFWVRNGGADSLSVEVEVPEPVGIDIDMPETRVTVKPGQARSLPVRIASRNGQPMWLPDGLQFRYTVQASGKGEVLFSLAETAEFGLRQVYPIAQVNDTQLPFNLNEPAELKRNVSGWSGPADASAEFGVSADADTLYIHIEVTDDDVLPAEPGDAAWFGDGVEVRINSQADPQRSLFRDGSTELVGPAYFGFSLMPGQTEATMAEFFAKGLPEGVTALCERSSVGYRVQIEVPRSVLDAYAGERAKRIRIGVALNDQDGGDANPAQLWWQHDWRSPESLSGSGTFEFTD